MLRQRNRLAGRLVDKTWLIALSELTLVRRNFMLRKIGAVALASTMLLSTTSAFAASSDQAALAPGKAAGVHEAALHAPLWIWIAGIGFVALGVGLLASGNGSGHSGGTSTTTGITH
jgi:Mn2+/Fe2+ NRAMP family transporter